MKRLVLHIGTEKTGTTTIQEYFHSYRSELFQNYGLYYPSFGYSSLAQFELVAALHPMSNEGRRAEFAPKRSFEPDDVWGRFIEDVKAVNADIVFVSSEHFSSRLNGSAISYISNALSEGLPEYEVNILLYLRNQVDMIQSSYSTYVKTGGVKRFGDMCAQMNGSGFYYNYYNLVLQWSEFFPRQVACKKFDEVGRNLLADVFSYLEVDHTPKKDFGAANRTWNPVFLEFCRLLNTGKLMDTPHGTRYEIYESLLRDCPAFSKYDGFGLVHEELARKIEGLFEGSNSNLARFLGSESGDYFDSWRPKKIAYDLNDFNRDLCGVFLESNVKGLKF